MRNDDLILGELREFKRAALIRLDRLETRLSKSEYVILRITGATALASFLSVILIEIFR